MAKPGRFCVVFFPESDRRIGKPKPPFYVFRGPLHSPDQVMNKCANSLQMKINISKGNIVFGAENEFNLRTRSFGKNVHQVNWEGPSVSGNLRDFIKDNVSKHLSAQSSSE